MIAKFINFVYLGYIQEGKIDLYKQLTQDKDEIDKAWFKLPYTDQLSSLAQARHIKMKLKALHLKMEKSTLAKRETLKHNVDLLHSKLDVKYKGNYNFPDDFNTTIFDKIIRMEHNRWNAYHYLNAWEYEEYLNLNSIKKEKKEKKLHNCLIPIEEFPYKKFVENPCDLKTELKKLIEWDIYSFIFIPNYLAETGYILQEVYKSE
jgi:hypothetical protein